VLCKCRLAKAAHFTANSVLAYLATCHKTRLGTAGRSSTRRRAQLGGAAASRPTGQGPEVVGVVAPHGRPGYPTRLPRSPGLVQPLVGGPSPSKRLSSWEGLEPGMVGFHASRKGVARAPSGCRRSRLTSRTRLKFEFGLHQSPAPWPGDRPCQGRNFAGTCPRKGPSAASPRSRAPAERPVTFVVMPLGGFEERRRRSAGE
jgi:hypothetical protein